MPKTILPIANGFYVSDSLPISAQECVNFFPVTESAPSLNGETLRGTPGISQIGTTGTASTDANRGALVHDGVPYFVNGQKLYSMNSSGTMTEIGDVIGTIPVSMATNGSQMIVIPPQSGTGYIYTSATSTFEAITDGDFTANGNPRMAAFIDGYFVITTDEGGKFIISALNDGLTYNALDFGSAESDPDGVLTPIVYKNQLFICGTNTIEGFTNIGGAGFPFQRSGLYLAQGITNILSVINAMDTFLFVGASDEATPMVWQFVGNQTQKISTLGIDRILREILPGDQIRSWYYAQNGQLFVGFVLNTTTIVYDLATGKWHERKSRLYDANCIETIVPHRVVSIVGAHGVIYGADSQDGRVGLIDMDITEEYNSEIIRTFATQPFQNNMDPFFVPMIELTIEAGIGGGGGAAGGGGLEPSLPAQVTCLYESVVSWFGYDDGFGRVVANTDGSVIMLNHRGATKLMVSEDFGANWVEKDMWGASLAEDKIVSMSYDPTNDRWYIAHTTESMRHLRVSYSDNNMDSYTLGVADASTYGHSVFWDDDAGHLYVPKGTATLTAVRYNDPVGDWNDDDELTFDPPVTGEGTNSWQMRPINSTQFIMFHGGVDGQSEGQDSYSIFNKTMGDVGETNLNSMVDSSGIPMSWATKGEGFVLNMKSWTTGIASFYKISPGLSAGAPPVVDIPSSFTNIAQNPEIAFGGVGSPLGGATGMYAVAMIDNDDRFSGEIWYCLGDNFDAWFGPIAFSLVGCNEYLPSNQQLYYLRDDKWVFVYTSRDDTIQFPFPSANIVELDLGGLS